MDASDLEKLYAGLDRNVESLYEDVDASGPEGLSWTDGGGDERYKRGAELGAGGVKVVFAAYDRATEQDVAMATLQPNATSIEVANFHREARLTASLDHPSIVRVLDIGFFSDGSPFFIMNLLPGKNLVNLISEGAPMPTSRALDMVLKVCDAMAYAHGQGVLHLDLKPDNIQIGSYGEVVVCDWGTARHFAQPESEDGVLPKAVSTVKGTPAYMAPEQAAGDMPSAATDVYALGAVTYTLLAGRRPYEGLEPEAVLAAIRAGEPPDALGEPALDSVPVALAAVVNKAMSARTDDRYGSVSEFRDDLERYLRGYATDAEDAGIWTLLRLIVQRHRTPVLMAGGIVALLVGLTFLFVSGLQQSRNLAIAAQEETLVHLHRAETERARSVALLDAIRKERAETVRLAGVVDDLRQPAARAAFLDHRFDDAATAYIELAAAHPDSRLIWQEKAVVHLVRQEFGAAVEAFAKADNDSNRPLMELAQRFFERKPDDTRLLMGRGTIEVLRGIPKVRPGIRLRFFVYATKNATPEACRPIVAFLLNHESARGQLTPILRATRSGTQLSFRSTRRTQLDSVLWEPDYPRAISLFSCLVPAEIDLSNLRLETVDDIRYVASLVHVVMPKSAVDLSPLHDLVKLQKITVAPGIYSASDLAALPAGVQVVVDPAAYAGPANK